MLVTADLRWYTRGWALTAPPTGSFATVLNINSWSLGVADRGPPGGTFKWDPTQMVDDGNGPIAPPPPAALLEGKPAIEQVAVHHTVVTEMSKLPSDFAPPAQIQEVVARLSRLQFAQAFGDDPCKLLSLPYSDILAISAKAQAEPQDVIWGALQICKGDGATLVPGPKEDPIAA